MTGPNESDTKDELKQPPAKKAKTSEITAMVSEDCHKELTNQMVGSKYPEIVDAVHA